VTTISSFTEVGGESGEDKPDDAAGDCLTFTSSTSSSDMTASSE
jgi:hypothetical protein